MRFFDRHQVFYPWPRILRQEGFKYTYRPRDVFWLRYFGKLDFKKDKKVLEVGCGRGVNLDRVRGEFGIDTFGLDISSGAINDAKRKSVYKHHLAVGSAERIPYKNLSFEDVFSLDTLEHVKDQKTAVHEMVRVLKHGGRILVYTINSRQKFTWNDLISKFGVDIYSDVEHDPKMFVNPKWLNDELIKNGIKVEEIAYFDAFFSLAANEAITLLLMFCQKFLGWEKNGNFAKMVLHMFSIFSKMITPVLILLDLPWTSLGHSNAFLVIGQKE